jgi:hypothetical protein
MAVPGKATAKLGQTMASLGLQIHEQAVKSERHISVVNAVTSAARDAEIWLQSQKPYDEKGNPRYETVGSDFKKWWTSRLNQATAEARDVKAKDEVVTKLTQYGAQLEVQVAATAQTWHIKEQIGQLYDTLENMAMLATTSPEAISQTISAMRGQLDLAVQNQLLSREKANAMLTQFTTTAVTGRVRAKLATGDYLGAGDDIRMLRNLKLREAEPGEFVAVDLNVITQLAGEYRAAIEKDQSAEAKRNKDIQEGLALEFIVSMRSHPERVPELLQLWDSIAGQDGVITDPDRYLKVRKAGTEISEGEDDQAVLRDAYMAYASGDLTPDYVAKITKKLSTPKLGYLAGLARATMQARAKEGTDKALFSDPVFKDARAYIEDRLRMQGRYAERMTYVEQYIIPTALRDFTNFALQRWTAQPGIEGRTLDYNVMMNKAENIVNRMEATIPTKNGFTIKNAPVPNYTTVELITQAYSKGEFGPVGSEGATARMANELRGLELWNMRQHIERMRQQEASNNEEEGMIAPSPGDRIRSLFD